MWIGIYTVDQYTYTVHCLGLWGILVRDKWSVVVKIIKKKSLLEKKDVNKFKTN